MKFNWGSKLAIFITLYVLIMIGFIFYFFSQKVNLVEENYYPKEQAFQQQIEKQKNSAFLTENIDIKESKEGINIVFPKINSNDSIQGKITFYRPSDPEKDVNFNIKTDTSLTQFISYEQLISGKYKLLIDWELNNIQYYFEKVIVIQK